MCRLCLISLAVACQAAVNILECISEPLVGQVPRKIKEIHILHFGGCCQIVPWPSSISSVTFPSLYLTPDILIFLTICVLNGGNLQLKFFSQISKIDCISDEIELFWSLMLPYTY